MLTVSFLSLLGGVMKKDIKLIAIDLDGTLLNEDKEIAAENKEIIQKLHDEGMEIVLATGRPFNGYWWIRQELGLEGWDDYTICNTGAFVRRNADGKVIVDNSLTKEDYEKITSFLDDEDLQISLFTKDILYNNADEVNEGFLTDQNIMMMPRQKFADFDDIPEKVARINFMGKEEELDKFYEKHKDKLESEYMTMRNETYSLEVLKKSSGKANSLEKLCEYLGISTDQVIYFGDGANDKKAIELAGVGVAMAAADDETKEVADYTTKENDDGGVAHFLKEYLGLGE